MDFSYLTILPRGRQIWDNIVFPPEEFKSRKEKLSGIMDELKVDGLIIYSDGLTRRYVSYLTNYCNSVAWSVSMSLVLRDREPIVISTMAPRDITYNKRHLAPGLELNAVGLGLISNHHVAEKTVAYIKENDLGDLKWAGVNLVTLPMAGYDPVMKAFPDIVDATGLFDKILSKKSGEEIFAISQAASMAKKAVLDYLRMAKPGENERDLAARIDRSLRVYGADNISFLVSAGKEGIALRQPDDYVIAEGDTVSAQINVMYLHYQGLFGATLVNSGRECGRSAYYDSFISDWNGMKKRIFDSKSIVGSNFVTQDGYALAQGIGADIAEAPFDSDTAGKIDEGSVFTLTLCNNSDEFGGAIISDTFACLNGALHSLCGEGACRIHYRT